jgi:hypothetical protein
MIKLDNCQHCCGEAKVIGGFHNNDPVVAYHRYRIICDVCGMGTLFHLTLEDAAAVWNRRAPDPQVMQAVIKAVVEGIERACENNPLRIGDMWSQGWQYHLGETREYLSPHLEALKGLIDD